MKTLMCAPAIAAVAFVVMAAGGDVRPAKADVLVSGGGRTVCATVLNNKLQLNRCNGGDAQNWFSNTLSRSSTQQHYHNLCLDSETPNGGAQLVVTTCQSKPSQRWQLRTNGVYENDSGWCTDLNGGYFSEGTRIQIWTCSAKPNQLWAPGQLQSKLMLQLSPAAASLPAGSVFGLRWGQTAGSSLIAANAGNMLTDRGVGGIVAQGGGNIVAQGGGNIVAQGGGNFINLTGGMIVAQGGGN